MRVSKKHTLAIFGGVVVIGSSVFLYIHLWDDVYAHWRDVGTDVMGRDDTSRSIGGGMTVTPFIPSNDHGEEANIVLAKAIALLDSASPCDAWVSFLQNHADTIRAVPSMRCALLLELGSRPQTKEWHLALDEVMPLREWLVCESREPALCVVVCHGQVDIVEMYLAAGADPNTISQYGPSVLALAVATGNVEVVALLRRSGADPKAPIGTGMSALACLKICPASDRDKERIAALLNE